MTLPTDRDKAERAKERANEQSTKPFDMVGPLCPACNEPVTYGEPDPNEYISDEAAAGFGVDRFAFEYSPDRIQGSNHDNPWDAVHVVPETVEIAAAPDEESTEELRVHAYKHDYSDEAYQMWKDELDEIEKNERRAETNQGLDDFATDGGVDQSEAAVEQGQIVQSKEGERYQIEDIEGADIVIGRLGDRILDECPVEEGGECIDSTCDGRVGERERDPETMSAHELYCFGCGLNWVERGSTWDETYAEWVTSFSYGDSDD